VTDYLIHPAATLFPPMTEDEFTGLVEDIKTNGQREPVVLYQGAVLDGVHRLKACQQLGREPLTREWNGDHGEPVAYVISVNLHRRHLSASQRAMIAAKLTRSLSEAASEREARKRNAPSPNGPGGMSKAQVADVLKVGSASIHRAQIVQHEGSPELVAAVESGEIPVSTAARVAGRYRKDEQLAQARLPKATPKRDPMKPKRMPTVPVLDRIDRALDTLETLAEAVFEPAIAQMRHDKRRDGWATRAREIRTNLSRFIARCEDA